MGTIVSNIKEIGIFMIVAQAVMHFAPGKQYEKYIKLIASVMVLLLFVNPFVSRAGDIETEWEVGMEQIMQELDEQQTGEKSQSLQGNTVVSNTAMQQIEENIQSRLNLVLEKEEYRVAEVEIQLEKIAGTDVREDGTEWSVGCIRIVMEKQSELYEEDNRNGDNIPIIIDDIIITSGTDMQEESDEEISYRRLFADTLGIGEDRVEVTCRGGW